MTLDSPPGGRRRWAESRCGELRLVATPAGGMLSGATLVGEKGGVRERGECEVDWLLAADAGVGSE